MSDHRDSGEPDRPEAGAPPFAGLDPDCILNAVESIGLRVDGRLLALNSYENRVYQVGMEEGPAMVVKFYRPERWIDAAIFEEHAFTQELAEREVPAVPPLSLQGSTLHRHAGFRFAVFPRHGGRAPELDRDDVLEWVGRFVARIHNVGATKPFAHRLVLDVETYGEQPCRFLQEGSFLPPDLRPVYDGVARQVLDGVRAAFERAGGIRRIRLHGDCHAGNVLWTDAGPHFVDFDDCLAGPAIQDLWMLLSGSPEEMGRQFGRVLEGYEVMRAFDRRELLLVEALRSLRLMHYAAWLARRWDDPAFPRAFPWFNSQRYWEEHILQLREQIPLMEEQPLQVP